jgi:hypothetical protein
MRGPTTLRLYDRWHHDIIYVFYLLNNREILSRCLGIGPPLTVAESENVNTKSQIRNSRLQCCC